LTATRQPVLAGAPQPRLTRHPPEYCDLPEERSPGLCGAADHLRARGHVGHQARLCADPDSISYAEMSGYHRLPTNLHEIAEHRRTGDAHVREGDAAAAEADTVLNLHEII
jgi:hypothetical protein